MPSGPVPRWDTDSGGGRTERGVSGCGGVRGGDDSGSGRRDRGDRPAPGNSSDA